MPKCRQGVFQSWFQPHVPVHVCRKAYDLKTDRRERGFAFPSVHVRNELDIAPFATYRKGNIGHGGKLTIHFRDICFKPPQIATHDRAAAYELTLIYSTMVCTVPTRGSKLRTTAASTTLGTLLLRVKSQHSFRSLELLIVTNKYVQSARYSRKQNKIRLALSKSIDSRGHIYSITRGWRLDTCRYTKVGNCH